MEKKTYYLGYNRYEGKVIVYSTVEHAQNGSKWWKEVQAYTLEQAKEQFLNNYKETHAEEE